MPKAPEGMDWDFQAPGSRFTLRPAFAVVVPEDDWHEVAGGDARSALERQVGSWAVDEADPELGAAVLVDGSAGRGAEVWIPVLEFLFDSAAKGVVGAAAGQAALAIWRRLRRSRANGPDDVAGSPIFVSRGAAVLLAAAHVHEAHNHEDSWALEAADEPMGMAGEATHEMGYAGVEPWIVLLRSASARMRCVVLVSPDGTILGATCTPLSEAELLFLGAF